MDPLLRHALASPGPSPSACLDPEALAAWSEGSLRAEERVALERHAADCARCRAMLAAFVRAEPVPTGEAAADARVPIWRRWRLTWLVPMAATATALAVYVATPSMPADSETMSTPAADVAATLDDVDPLAGQRSDQVSARSVTAPEVPSPTFRAPSPVVPPASAPGTQETAVARRERSRETSTREATGPKAAQEADAREANVGARAKQPGLAEAAAPPAASAGAPDTAPARPVTAEAVAGAAGRFADALPPAGAAVSPPASAAPSPAAPASAAPAPGAASARPPRDDRAQLEEARPSDPSGSRLNRAAPSAVAARADGESRAVTMSGEPSRSWRVIGARIERPAGADGWREVRLPPGVSGSQVLAGTMAGRAVWLVGRSGLVLKAPDGESLTRATVPVSVDLVSVAAAGAMGATVTAVDGRRFATVDGGATWSAR